MAFNSINYLLFLPIMFILNQVTRGKIRNIILLIGSYYFYACWNVKFLPLIIIVTLITYICAILLDKNKDNTRVRRIILCLCIIFVFSFLFYFKYFAWTLSLLSRLLGLVHLDITLTIPDILLPVGISFFTFQSIGYVIDVYRGDCSTERNIITYALFVAFFPQLVAGPIERASNLLSRLKSDNRHVDVSGLLKGFIYVLWGLFIKMAIADRAAIFVNNVFDDYHAYNGIQLLVASFCFSLQIYCDFAGYSYIAIGSAKLLGLSLMENFRQPYLSRSVSEFWRRWHISLNSWFKDYVYIPLGGNKKGQIRKNVNVMIVFLLSGLWHGAALHFLAWGGINGLFVVLENYLKSKFKVDENRTFSTDLFKIIGTGIVVNFAWVFFRANTIADALGILKGIITDFHIKYLFNNSLFDAGLNYKNMHGLMVFVLILFGVDIISAKVKTLDWLEKQNYLFKLFIYEALIMGIIIFGIYGGNYDAAQFIYFQF